MTKEPEGVVTVLFTDIVGSVPLKTSHGDAGAQDIVRTNFDLLRRQVQAHNGRDAWMDRGAVSRPRWTQIGRAHPELD